MQRVWNVTDGPFSPVKGQTLMVLGRVLKPGRAVQVEEARLVKAHKVHALVKEGWLYIGPKLPDWYVAMKKPPRATADARKVDELGGYVGATIVKPVLGHGVAPTPPTAEEKKIVKAVDALEMKDVVEAKEKDEPKSSKSRKRS